MNLCPALTHTLRVRRQVPHNWRSLPTTVLRTCTSIMTYSERNTTAAGTQISQTRLLKLYICFQSFLYLHIRSTKCIKRKESKKHAATDATISTTTTTTTTTTIRFLSPSKHKRLFDVYSTPLTSILIL
jgi:hypothetical protein